MDLAGNIVLCSMDGLGLDDRFYQGRLAHLSLFSTPLEAVQVKSLYQSVMGQGPAPSPGPSSSQLESTWVDQFQNDSSLQVRHCDSDACCNLSLQAAKQAHALLLGNVCILGGQVSAFMP